MSFLTMLYVVLGGAVGTFFRHTISVLALPIDRNLPWGTILINVTGCALIGFFGTLTLAQGRYPVSENVRLFVMTGICGGYTTFSAFGLQTFDLMRNGAMVRAILNVILSLVLGVCALALGHFAASQLNDHARQIAQIEIEEEA